jgi:hypothetical protein
MVEIGLLDNLDFWAGFSAGVAVTISVAVLITRITRRAKKSKTGGEKNNPDELSQRQVAETIRRDELFQRQVAETIRRVEPDIPEPLRPYLAYRGPVPEPLKANWFPRELVIEAPGQEPQRVEVFKDGYGFLYARIDKAK